MNNENELKKQLIKYDKDTIIDLYIQAKFDKEVELAEKDKEIINIRHEICEEIREKADKRSSLYKDNSLAYIVRQDILDQIEKGEENEKDNNIS